MIYPCKDMPTVCGWGILPDYECAYPYCWWGGQYLYQYIKDIHMDMTKGSRFVGILYQGTSEVIADTMFKYLSSAKDKKESLPLNGTSKHIRVLGVELVNMRDSNNVNNYNLTITGEIE